MPICPGPLAVPELLRAGHRPEKAAAADRRGRPGGTLLDHLCSRLLQDPFTYFPTGNFPAIFEGNMVGNFFLPHFSRDSYPALCMPHPIVVSVTGRKGDFFYCFDLFHSLYMHRGPYLFRFQVIIM